MYLLNLAWFFGCQCSAHWCVNTSQVVQKCPYVSQEPPKKFGAWGPNRSQDIGLPTPHIFAQLDQVSGALALCLQVCQHLPSGLKYSYVSQELLKNLVHGALIEAEILTSPSPMYLLKSAQFWALTLCPQVCQYLPSDLEMFLYVS